MSACTSVGPARRGPTATAVDDEDDVKEEDDEEDLPEAQAS